MSKTWFRAAASDGVGDISIYDEIGLWGITAKDFQTALKALGNVSEINLSINSPGGDVFDGLAIHNMLKRHKAVVTVMVDGIAASIASIIAMAGDVVKMPRNAMMMVHDPSGIVVGTSSDMREIADALDKIKTGLVSAYADKTGMDRDEIADLMKAETWLTAEEATDLGFADVIDEPRQMAATFDLSKFKNAPADAGRKPRGPLPAAPTPADPKEIPMTDSATPAAAPETPAGAPETPAATPETPAAPVAEPETPAAIEARATAAANTRAADIAAACKLVGQSDKAAEFIASGKSLGEVLAELKPVPVTDELNARRSSGVASPDTKAAWDKAVNKANARVKAA